MTDRFDPAKTASLWWPSRAFASMARVMDERAAAMVEGAVMAQLELARQLTCMAMGRAAPLQAARAVTLAAVRPTLRRRGPR